MKDKLTDGIVSYMDYVRSLKTPQAQEAVLRHDERKRRLSSMSTIHKQIKSEKRNFFGL